MPLRSKFSGAGGLDIGAEQAAQENLQIHTRIALDNWSDACNTLKGYFKSKAEVIHADIVTIGNPLQCWRTLSGETKPPDLVYGGPPCQSFSQAGKQKGATDERGQLIFEFLRFVSSLQPAFFVMENVSNLKGVERGALYTQIIEQIERLNYNVTVETLLAADFGAPQLRRRLLFLGCRNDIGHLSLPTPTHSENPTLFGSPYTTVGEAFQGLPEAQYTANLQKCIKRKFNKEATKKIFLPV